MAGIVRSRNIVVVGRLANAVPTGAPILVRYTSASIDGGRMAPIMDSTTIPSSLTTRIGNICFYVNGELSNRCGSIGFSTSDVQTFSTGSCNCVTVAASGSTLASIGVSRSTNGKSGIDVLTVPTGD